MIELSTAELSTNVPGLAWQAEVPTAALTTLPTGQGEGRAGLGGTAAQQRPIVLRLTVNPVYQECTGIHGKCTICLSYACTPASNK